MEQPKMKSIIDIVNEKQGWTESFLTNLNDVTLHNPFLLENMDAFVDALHRYHDQQKVITIIPDYDTDGVCSGMLLAAGLDIIGFDTVHVFKPSIQTGYGVTEASAEQALLSYPDTEVFITTDNGSNAFSGIDYLTKKGYPVLVTDHHKAVDGDPTPIAVNPNRTSDTYPFKGISGTTVAWKAVLAYGERYCTPEQNKLLYNLIWLCGISTISDVMVLLDENRLIVEQTIQILQTNHTLKPWFEDEFSNYPILKNLYSGFDALVSLLEENKAFNYGWDESTLGFVFGPIFNSPRRMSGKSSMSFDLLLESDVSKQKALAETLVETNTERKTIMKKKAREYFKAPLQAIKLDKSPVIYMTGVVPIGHGLVGLLAGQFTNHFDLPSIVFGKHDLTDIAYDSLPDFSEDETITASGRSPEWFDLHSCLKTIYEGYPDVIVGFGGHEQAAGVTVRAKHYDLFRQLFLDYVMVVMHRREKAIQETPESEMLGQSPIVWMSDHVGSYSDVPLTYDRVRELIEVKSYLDGLKPYGQGFKEPQFGLIFDTSSVDVSFMGSDKQHVKFRFKDTGLVVLYWNGRESLVEQLSHVQGHIPFHITGKISINEWNNRQTVQIVADMVTPKFS